jgi:hypothetical protein
MKEILWTELFPSGYQYNDTSFYYEDTSGSYESMMEKAEKARELLQEIRDLFETGPIYVKLTAGAKAGTIARITKKPGNIIHSDDDNNPPSKVKIVTHKGWNNKGGSAHIYGNILLSSSRWGGHGMCEASVDGKVVLEWNPSSSSMKTARPVLLIGYTGGEVLVKGKPSKVKPSISIKDRYGRDVTAGDLVIVGQRYGHLIVGKITHISDARTVKIKHIGAKEEAKIPGVMDDQVLLLSDDIKQVLMMEKLKML